jgi:hypothetical protein
MVKSLRNNMMGAPVTIVDKAVSDTNGTQDIDEETHIYHNTTNQFETITFDELVKDVDRIDFMKIDCEGGEYSVFTPENYEYITTKIKHIAGEWHLWGVPAALDNFLKFRDLYLTNRKFRAFDRDDKEVTDKMFDDMFLKRYSHSLKHGAQLIIYMDN